MKAATAIKAPDGTVDLRFPYHRGLVDCLKVRVLAPYRAWDSEGKVWTVRPPFVSVAVDLLLSVYPDAVVVEPDDYRTPPPGPSPLRRTDQWLAELHLLPSAPPALVRAAYRCLTKEHHPDAGGSTARMSALNLAYEALRERGVA